MFRKVFIASSLLIVLVIPALAGQRQRQQRKEGNDFGRIQRELNLTADQASSLKSLLESERQTLQPLTKEARDKAQALRDLQGQPDPNPTDISNAVSAMKASRQQLQDARENFQQSLKNLLTPEQIQKLDQTKQRAGRLRGQPGAERQKKRNR
jgi:Spy/CpxP family protein refolding chaperone